MSVVKRLTLVLLAIAVIATAPLPAFAKLDDKAWKEAVRALEGALAQNPPSSDAIAEAVRRIGEDQSARAVDMLVKVGARLDDIKVYDAVKAALAGMSEPDAVEAMLKELKQNSKPEAWALRCVLVDCLSGVKGDGVTAAIVKALDDRMPYVISAAAKSLGRRRDKEAIQPLIDKLKDLEKNKDVVWVDVKQALTTITGEDFADSKEWQSWWDVRKADFDPEKNRGDKSESTTTLRPGEESADFFSQPIVAKRIMFVIDISGSMEAQDIPVEGKGTQKRIAVVKDELIRCVKGLKKDVKFNIVAYSHTLKTWQKIKAGASALVDASPASKADAIKWVGNMKADGATHTDDALKKAFDPLEVNQIILLSDGRPEKINAQKNGTEPYPPDKILEMVRGLNRLRGVKINTFCFAVFQGMGGAEELLDFMEKLAKENGGKLTLCGGGGRPKPQPPQN